MIRELEHLHRVSQARVLESPRGPPELVDDSSECDSSASYCCSAFSCSEDDFEGEDLCWDHFDVLGCCLVDEGEPDTPCLPAPAPKSGLDITYDVEGSPTGITSVKVPCFSSGNCPALKSATGKTLKRVSFHGGDDQSPVDDFIEIGDLEAREWHDVQVEHVPKDLSLRRANDGLTKAKVAVSLDMPGKGRKR